MACFDFNTDVELELLKGEIPWRLRSTSCALQRALEEIEASVDAHFTTRTETSGQRLDRWSKEARSMTTAQPLDRHTLADVQRDLAPAAFTLLESIRERAKEALECGRLSASATTLCVIEAEIAVLLRQRDREAA
jgi:hypothetical protein